MKSKAFNFSTNISISEAKALQMQLATQIICADTFSNVKIITGVDVGYSKKTDQLVAAAISLDSTTFEIIEKAFFISKTQFPYISGLFSFRELPPVAEAIQKLSTTPDLIICDGQGIAHPRGFGLASHLGFAFQIPTIGCAKNKLYGQQSKIIKYNRGDKSILINCSGDIIGAVLRTQDNVKPVYVSVGHMISLETACYWVLKCATRYRLPDSTRYADQEVKKILKTL